MNKTSLIIAAALAVCSCGGNQHKADDPLADTGRTQRTESLLTNLMAIGDSSSWLFGHQDATVRGVAWEADFNSDSTVHQRSDVKSVCNDHPALIGFDLGGIEYGNDKNTDGVPFSRIRQEAIAHFGRGGMVTLSWTVDSTDKSEADIDRVAQYLNTIETTYGVKVPILFRLRGAFTKALWQNVARRLKEKGVVNALYVYSSGAGADSDGQKYMERYPGDDIIDILGIDCYCYADDDETTQTADYAAKLDNSLTMLCRLAKEHKKAVALTETGFDGIKTTDWWTRTLSPVLARHHLSYALVWHNNTKHYFAPFPGQKSVSDFIRFYNDKQTLFLSDVNGLYRN